MRRGQGQSGGVVLTGPARAMAGLVDFQDEEQVKSFLENMEVECNYQCYREKDPDGERRLQGFKDTWGLRPQGRGLTGHASDL